MEKSPVIRTIEAANARYVASFGEKGNLAVRPACRYAILMCMDSRMLPSRFAGLAEGDAHIIRNAGGRASEDAIRSLVVSYKLLGTKEFFVIHHTDCGMVLFDGPTMAGLLASSLEQAVRDGDGWRDVGVGPGSPEGAKIDWLTFTSERQAVIDDVTKIRTHPLIPRTIPVYGYIYDVRTGRLDEVPEAMAIGAASA
jgi:carbonic anhydrase